MKVKLSKYAKLNGVSVRTLWRRINDGSLLIERSKTGRIFVNIEEGWCFTKNGSIYKLLEHKTFLEIEDLMYSDTFKIEVGHDHKVEQ